MCVHASIPCEILQAVRDIPRRRWFPLTLSTAGPAPITQNPVQAPWTRAMVKRPPLLSPTLPMDLSKSKPRSNRGHCLQLRKLNMRYTLRENPVSSWFRRSTMESSRYRPIWLTVGAGLSLMIGLLVLMRWERLGQAESPTQAGWWSWSVLLVGLAAICLAAVYTWWSTTRQEEIKQLAAQQTREMPVKEKQLRQSMARVRTLQMSYEDTVQLLMKALLCHNQETGMHVKRIGLLSEMLALAAGWSSVNAQNIRLAAPMHDVGMIRIPDTIVLKPGKLTPDEFEVVKTHTLIGARMIEGSPSDEILTMAHRIALYHHERWDGKGYPHRLSGTDIPEAARIVSICDVYDALSHSRVYRPPVPPVEILNTLKKGAGTHFDPNLVNLFLAHYEQAQSIARDNPDEVLVGVAPCFISPAPTTFTTPNASALV